MGERMIEANGVELCTEPFGDPGDPPVLLVMGVGGSMLWWQEGFCRLLAEGGRFVIRYDHRDTGRSVTYEPGDPTRSSTKHSRPTSARWSNSRRSSSARSRRGPTLEVQRGECDEQRTGGT